MPHQGYLGWLPQAGTLLVGRVLKTRGLLEWQRIAAMAHGFGSRSKANCSSVLSHFAMSPVMIPVACTSLKSQPNVGRKEESRIR